MARTPGTRSAPAGRRADASRATAAPGDRAVDLADLPNYTGYLLRRAQLAVFDDFSRTFAAVDLRPAQFSVLLVIQKNPGLKQSEVSAALGIQRTNFVALIDKLEKRGLVRREPVAGDRRAYALVLTAAGRETLREALAIQARNEKRLAAMLGPGGRERLLELLAIIARM
ncbi:MAG: MarR family winged helix-turn-helix transcriptional regulator [Rhodospirillales bacterium]